MHKFLIKFSALFLVTISNTKFSNTKFMANSYLKKVLVAECKYHLSYITKTFSELLNVFLIPF